MKVLRIYFTEFNEDKYVELVNKLKTMGFNVIEHKSSVVPEFRYIELTDFTDDVEKVRKEVESIIKDQEFIKLDLIDVAKPYRR